MSVGSYTTVLCKWASMAECLDSVSLASLLQNSLDNSYLLSTVHLQECISALEATGNQHLSTVRSYIDAHHLSNVGVCEAHFSEDCKLELEFQGQTETFFGRSIVLSELHKELSSVAPFTPLSCSWYISAPNHSEDFHAIGIQIKCSDRCSIFDHVLVSCDGTIHHIHRMLLGDEQGVHFGGFV